MTASPPPTPPLTSQPGNGPYGPETPAVRRFLQQLAQLNAEGRAKVSARYERVTVTRAFDRADRALGDAIARTDRTTMRDALSGPLLQLVRKTEGDRSDSNDVSTDSGALDDVAEPALAAALALMMRDVLRDEDFRELYTAFAEVMPID